MTRRGVIWLLAGSAVAAILAGCSRGPSAEYRFKMTVEVETPQGLRTGSSVYEVRAWYEPGLDPSGKVRAWKVRGEAVAVELPGGKLLFALLKTIDPMSDNLAEMSMAALDPAYRNDWVESATRIAAGTGIRSPAQVTGSEYPLLVTFRDIRDPKSVERVDPANLAATFGPGVTLRRITVAVTDDPVTNGIEKRLPLAFWRQWGSTHKAEMGKNGGVMNNPYFSTLAGTLSRDDFTTEKAR